MKEYISECCGAIPWMNETQYGICGDCKEHTTFIKIENNYGK